MPYALQIANKGVEQAVAENQALALGVNVANGSITYKAVARDLGYEYVSVAESERLIFGDCLFNAFICDLQSVRHSDVC